MRAKRGAESKLHGRADSPARPNQVHPAAPIALEKGLIKGPPQRARKTIDLRGAFLRLVVIAAILSLLTNCGDRAQAIVGQWRGAGDSSNMIWEFSRDGSVQMGSTRGKYTFGDRERVKIETPSATSVYQMELLGDHLTLKDPSGSKLEFTRVK